MLRFLQISLRLLFLSFENGNRVQREVLSRTSLKLTKPFATRFPDEFQDGGATSLLPLNDDQVLFGDKLGRLIISRIKNATDGTPYPSASRSFCPNVNGDTTSSRPSPVFCLELAADREQIFSGAGWYMRCTVK